MIKEALHKISATHLDSPPNRGSFMLIRPDDRFMMGIIETIPIAAAGYAAARLGLVLLTDGPVNQLGHLASSQELPLLQALYFFLPQHLSRVTQY